MNVMTDASRTTPRKVLRRAAELGVHADCVAADHQGACDTCIDLINQAFHEHYGHANNAAEALSMIIDDLIKDREEDS